MKLSVEPNCYGDMHETITTEGLIRQYRRMAGHRIHKEYFMGKVNRVPIHKIAVDLKSPKLCRLYVESQFNAMPAEFCREKFGKSYPPVNVCFGGRAWERYQDYITRGFADAT